MQKKEIFVGIVAALGTDLNATFRQITENLRIMKFETRIIFLSDLIREYRPNLPLTPEDKRINSLMDAGNDFREKTKRNDFLSLLAINKLKEIRSQNKNRENIAYIFKSLKHPEEVKTFREVYQSSFYLVSLYSPRDRRRINLENRVSLSHNKNIDTEIKNIVDKLLARDVSEKEIKTFGQNTRDTYILADIFIDVTDETKSNESIRRFVNLIFGNPFSYPSNDEFGMFNAFGIAKRSNSLARQVGAAITNQEGEILTTGVNETPFLTKSDNDNFRGNYQLGYDPNDQNKTATLKDLLMKLKDLDKLKDIDVDDLVAEVRPKLKYTKLMNLIEFTTEVHAEMSAIINASKNTISIKDCILYTTTFPCHDCTKHIIAAGITRVVYIESYPKSLAEVLFYDLISVDTSGGLPSTIKFEPFVGIAPRCYLPLFDMKDRKDQTGKVIEWNSSNAQLRYYERSKFNKIRELEKIKVLDNLKDIDL